MKTYALLSVLFVSCVLSALAEGPATETEPTPLPSNVVARINGTDIPTEWFMHEFRSSFFKHMDEDNVRTATLEPFLKRFILTEGARELGILDQPEVQQEIKRRIEGMRAYMEYQLAMAEIGIINQALVESLDLSKIPGDITDEEVEQFFGEKIDGQPGAPESIKALPPKAIDSIKQQIARTATEHELNQLILEWKKDMTIEINEEAVQSIPMPEMKGKPPVGMP